MSDSLPAKRDKGAPTKRTPIVEDAICELVEDGIPISKAAPIAGISYQTLCVWRREFPELEEKIELAKAKGISARLKRIRNAAKAGDWRADAWLLEHCNPEHFSKSRIQIEGVARVEHTHTHTISKELLDSIAEARERHQQRAIAGE